MTKKESGVLLALVADLDQSAAIYAEKSRAHIPETGDDFNKILWHGVSMGVSESARGLRTVLAFMGVRQ